MSQSSKDHKGVGSRFLESFSKITGKNNAATDDDDDGDAGDKARYTAIDWPPPGTEDEAEGTILASIEKRNQFLPMQGRRTLAIMESLTDDDDDDDEGQNSAKPTLRLAYLAARMNSIQKLSSSTKIQKYSSGMSDAAEETPNKSKPTPSSTKLKGVITNVRLSMALNKTRGDIFQHVGGDEHRNLKGKSDMATRGSSVDKFIGAALAVDKLFQKSTESDSDSDNDSDSDSDSDNPDQDQSTNDLVTSETTPLKSRNDPEAGAYSENKQDDQKKKKKKKKKRGLLRRCFGFKSLKSSGLSEIINYSSFLHGMRRLLFSSFLTFITVPFTILGVLLYYYSNLYLDFLPGEVPLSWWCLFAARQALMLELAIFVEFMCVDGIALRTKWAVKLCGPLVTLFAIQADGWPFIAAAWALCDLIFLHGDNQFQQNWLGVLGIEVFSPENPGGYILDSPFYFRVLLAMLTVGVAHALKRTVMAMYFGKRSFVTYKPRLERILEDIYFVTVVAEFSREMDALKLVDSELEVQRGTSHKLQELRFTSYRQQRNNFNSIAEVDDEEDDNEEEADEVEYPLSEDEETSSIASSTIQKTDTPLSPMPSRRCPPTTPSGIVRVSSAGRKTINIKTSARRVKTMLDRWSEPVNKLDRTDDASISDILKFRKALTYMDDEYPFSPSFGKASTRDECIKSAQRTFHHLLRGGKDTLDFDFLCLALNEQHKDEEANIDETKRRGLKRLFHPNRQQEISMIAFIQACDNVYKRLRFFRASVGNSSVIDNVLEGMIDGLFGGVLAVLVMLIFKFNPYPLLVSISTLMVSFAFAFGPSASKYIEGILLIATRRPYDLGDRILLSGPNSPPETNPAASWFVEDINLSSTTLRYAASNEVATVSNGSIAQARIINCARSSNAVINHQVVLSYDATDEQIDQFQDSIEKYIANLSNRWHSIIFFLCGKVNSGEGYVEYNLRVRHVRPWQETPIILNNQGELVRFVASLAKEMKIDYKGRTQKVQAVGEASGRNAHLGETRTIPEYHQRPHSSHHSSLIPTRMNRAPENVLGVPKLKAAGVDFDTMEGTGEPPVFEN